MLYEVPQNWFSFCVSNAQDAISRAVRRRRRAAAAAILLTGPPPIVTDRRAAAAVFVTCSLHVVHQLYVARFL